MVTRKLRKRELLLLIALVLSVFMIACKAKEKVPTKQEAETMKQTEMTSEEAKENDTIVEEPEVIVEGAKQIQINNETTYQTIEGFGAAYAWYIEWMTDNPHDQEVYDLLFSEVGTTIIRLKNTYKYNSTFEPKAELELYQEAEKRAEANGEKITVLMSSWSPAAYLKENGAIPGGSSIKKDENGHYMYDEYGQYWLELVKAYEEYGIPIDYISIQNECDFVADYDGCEFGISETDTLASYSKAYLAVYRALQTMEKPPKMMGPETMTVDPGQISAYMKEVFEQAPESVYGIAHHLYAGGNSDSPNSFMMSMLKLKEDYADYSKWQTEYYRGDVLNTAWIIHNSLTLENLNAYLYWNGVWAQPEGLIGFEHPWTATQNNEKGYEVYDKLYALRHFSEFIRPGYKRIDVAPTKDVNLLMSAYASEDQNKIAVVAINKSSEDMLIQLHLSAYEIENSKVYISKVQEGYTREDLYVPSGALKENQTLTIPAMGIVTIDISGKAKEGIVISDGNLKPGETEVSNETAKKLQVTNREITIGEDNAAIWDTVNGEKISNVANGDHGASAEFKAFWSDQYLYIRTRISDNTPDTSAADYSNQDSVELYLNEDHTKPEVYGPGDQHVIITRDNKVKADTGSVAKQVMSTVISDEEGYTLEIAIPFKSITPQKGKEIGFDIQINDSHGQGLRNYVLKWSDISLSTDVSLKGVGTLILN